MENLFKNFSKAALLLLFVIFAASCKKEKEKEPQPTARQNLTTVSQQGAGEVTSITNGEGATTMFSFDAFLTKDSSALNRQQSRNVKSRVQRFIRNLPFNKGNVNGRVEMDTTGNFDFNAHKGTYTWNATSDSWDFDSTNTTTIKIIFPSDTLQPTVTDAVLTISVYTQSQILVEDTTDIGPPLHYYYLPTALTADLFVGPTKYASVDFTATWNSDGEPTALDLTLFVKPYTLTIAFTSGTDQVTVTAALNDGTIDIVGIGGPFVVNFVPGTAKEDVKDIDGYVSYRELKLQTSSPINVEALDLLLDPKAVNFNQHINVDVLYSNSTIGSILFEDDPNMLGEILVYILFNDGTKEPAETYLCPIQENMCTEFDGTWDSANCECM